MEANNMAEMREAMSAALEQVNKVYDILSRPCVVIEEARQGCREARGVLIPALAAPPRNCDRFKTKEEAAIAFAKEKKQWIPQQVLWELAPWLDWLLAPATEQKGESNGSK